MRTLALASLLALAAIAAMAPVQGAIGIYHFDDPARERRFHGLLEELRCPKCLNTNLAGSSAPIASDLRRQVYRMVREGRSDEAIRDYLRERYGDFILYDPRLTPATLALWFGPMVLVLIGAGVIVYMVRRQRAEGGGEAPLSAAEQERVRTALERDETGGGEGPAR